MLDPKNLSKDNLRLEFSKNHDKYYRVGLFDELGFGRNTCSICGKNFWSIEKRDVCEDTDHTEYAFFKKNPLEMGYVDFWRRFEDFFKENGHASMDRYPVVSRWRQDLYFTIASIQDFQRIEDGKISFEYGANPVIVPQMCLRFGDIDNVGFTGRHFTGFMMAGQHAFNVPEEGYWKDRTIELNFKFLTEVMGIRKEDIIYSEDVWSMPDFSAFGPSLESFSKGLELVNSVFTQFELSNGSISELQSKVVDVGWGFERLLWYSSGTDNAYEAVFRTTLERIRKKTGLEMDAKLFKRFAGIAGELNMEDAKDVNMKEGELLKRAGITKKEYENSIKPLQAFYATLDHTRTLLFAITDGALPSNVGGGYNLRIILRRALDFMDRYGFGVEIAEIAEYIAMDLKGLYPELESSMKSGEFEEVVDTESKRYKKSKESSLRIVEAMIAKNERMDSNKFRMLYESNGVTPDFMRSVAASKGIHMDIPENLYEDMIVGDIVKKERHKKQQELPKGLPETEQLYYNSISSSKSKVLFSARNIVVLDKSPFYPEGGGQASDRGTIENINVIDVQKHNGVIVHLMEEDIGGTEEFKTGSQVNADVDVDRRCRLIAHHTATHLISAASRAILGKHAWQEGARKEPDKAHIDIAHFERLTEKQLDDIESLVNRWIRDGIKVEARIMDRGEAESKYGFEIYQGHGVPAKKMRIILIQSDDGRFIDAEACGGLHAVGMEHAIGMIKIISSYRLHDGIDRIEFVAGEAALDYVRSISKSLSEAAMKANADPFKLDEKIGSILEESKELRKQMQEYKEVVSAQIAGSMKGSETVDKKLDVPRDMLRLIATETTRLNNNAIVMLRNESGDVVCISGENSKEDALEFIKSRSSGKKFVGGGSSKFAEGRLV